MPSKKKPHKTFRRGDVVKLMEGGSYYDSFGAAKHHLFLVENYPSKYWGVVDKIADEFVDLVLIDGSPLEYSGDHCFACASSEEVELDEFLTAARKATGRDIPPTKLKRNNRGWRI